MFYCSEPELINPNHPGSSEYVSTSSSNLNKLVLEKRPDGIQISILGSEPGIEEWIISPYSLSAESFVWLEREIKILSTGDSILTQLDSLAEWGRTISYISYAKNAAGKTRGIDTVSIDYNFIQPVCEFSAETDDDSNSFEIIVIPDDSDKSLVTALQFRQSIQRLSVEVDEYTPDTDTLRVSVSGFNWPDNFNYSLQFAGGNHVSEDFGGWFTILPPSLNGEARFLGVTGMNLQLTPNTNDSWLPLTGLDSVRVNWKLPTGYTMKINEEDADTLSCSINTIGKDSIAIVDWSKEQLNHITIQGYSSTWSKAFEDTLVKDIELPREISEMSFIPGDTSIGLLPFYMDIYEVSYGKALEWSIQLNISHLIDPIQTSYNNMIDNSTPELIPAIAIDQSMVTSLPENRSLPTIEQWRMAGTGHANGIGLPLVGYNYAEPEICNYSNSGDNFETDYPYLPLVPIDFFSAERTNTDYLVYDNTPAVSASPFGIYQMCGNMAEWVTSSDQIDAVLVGGSFWSAIDDTLFEVEYSTVPFNGQPAREDWGFRTVINDVDQPPYLNNDLKLR
jgi:hypothetical protein